MSHLKKTREFHEIFNVKYIQHLNNKISLSLSLSFSLSLSLSLSLLHVMPIAVLSVFGLQIMPIAVFLFTVT